MGSLRCIFAPRLPPPQPGALYSALAPSLRSQPIPPMPLARRFIALAAALGALSAVHIAVPPRAARAEPLEQEPPKSGASMPRPKNYTPPRYPPEAEAAGLEA